MSLWPFNTWLPELLTSCDTAPALMMAPSVQGDGLRYGEWQGHWLEPGVDAIENRIYQPGDSVRHINWRASARSDHVYVKYQPKSVELRLKLLVDLRASTWLGTRVRTKAEQITRAAFYVAKQFSASVVVDTQLWSYTTPTLPVLRGSARWHSWADAWQPLLVSLAQVQTGACLPLVDALIDHQDQLCVIVSDFIDWDDALETQLWEASLRGHVWLVHVLDRYEVHLPTAGAYTLGDMGTLPNREVIDAYQQHIQAYLQRIQAWVEQQPQVDYWPLWADASLSQLSRQIDWS